MMDPNVNNWPAMKCGHKATAYWDDDGYVCVLCYPNKESLQRDD